MVQNIKQIWQEMMDYWSNRLDCRLENARKPEDQWQDCAAKK
jgi:hypothetical protein